MVAKGEEEIIWQSDQRNNSDDSVVNDIVEFNVNMRLDTDKIYLMKIDVPQGTISCGDLTAEWREEGKGYLVHAKARYYQNRYYFRRSYNGKVYEMAFTN